MQEQTDTLKKGATRVVVPGNAKQAGMTEPGWDRLERECRRNRTSAASVYQYAYSIGTVRGLAGKPLLGLTTDEVETLDEKLAGRAACVRTEFKMFLRANKRFDLDAALPRRRRPAKPRERFEETVYPDEAMRLSAAASSDELRAIVAVLWSCGGRITETVSIQTPDVKPSNGGYKIWFSEAKENGQERYGPKVSGPFKEVIDEYLDAKDGPRTTGGKWLFPSHKSGSLHVTAKTVREMLASLAKRAGVSKSVNPHWFRHSRISWSYVRGSPHHIEADAERSVAFWGIPNSPMMNRYAHLGGLDFDMVMTNAEPTAPAMPEVPTYIAPPPTMARKVDDLEAKLKLIEERTDEWLRLRAKVLGMDPRLVLDTPLSPDESRDPQEREAARRDAKP